MTNHQTLNAEPATKAASEEEPVNQATGQPAAERLVEETLVEEVSIDGMCGVY